MNLAEKIIQRLKEFNAEMTPEQRDAQRQSFAYGNCNIDNPDVTREVVAEAAKAFPHPSPEPPAPERL